MYTYIYIHMDMDTATYRIRPRTRSRTVTYPSRHVQDFPEAGLALPRAGPSNPEEGPFQESSSEAGLSPESGLSIYFLAYPGLSCPNAGNSGLSCPKADLSLPGAGPSTPEEGQSQEPFPEGPFPGGRSRGGPIHLIPKEGLFRPFLS